MKTLTNFIKINKFPQSKIILKKDINYEYKKIIFYVFFKELIKLIKGTTSIEKI